MAQQELAERIRSARAGAKHGDIFTPAISAHVRRVLRPETKEPGTKAAIKDDNQNKTVDSGTLPRVSDADKKRYAAVTGGK